MIRPLRRAAVLVAIGTVPAIAQTAVKAPVTFEWVFGDEGRRISTLPQTAWLADGTLMFYDGRLPAAQRAFEIIDPASGARRRAVDIAAALASLNALLPRDEAQRSLAWPQSFDAAGKHALYTFDGDLYVLELPTARFTRITTTPDEEHSAEFSPDGRRLAFVRANDLYVVDVDARAETRLTRDGSATTLNGTLSWLYWEEVFGRRDIGYWWSPDSRTIAYLQTDESKVDAVSFVDFQPLTPRVIVQRYPKAGRPNPRARVGIVDVASAAHPTTWVKITDKPFDVIQRVKWLPDGKRVSIETLTRNQRDLGLYFADRATGTAKRILTETDSAWVTIHDDLHFLADGKHFLWASERDDYYHIYRFTLDGRLVNQVTHGKWALASSGGLFWVRQAVAGIDEQHDWMYFTAMEASPLERHLYRVHLDGSGMTRLTTAAGVHRVSMSPDAKSYVDVFSDARTLPSLTLSSVGDAGSAEKARDVVLAPARTEALSRFDVQYPEIASIPTRDAFPMPARILKPAGFRADRKYPVIMAIYGGASSATVTNAWQSDVLFYQLLLNEGYVIVKVDNRSATAISKRLENTAFGTIGRSDSDDLIDAARWLKRQSWIDSTRVGVWGWSNGGYMTLSVLTRSSEFKAGIAVAPVTDWRFYDSKWSEAFLGLPSENPVGYDSASVVTRAAQLHGHLLLVHGSYDDNVHPQNEQTFMEALIKAGKPFELMVYPMRKHDIGDRDANNHLYRTMIDFWKRSL